MIFRNALPGEAEALTELTLASKRHWGYPEECIKIWTEELTIRPKYIEENTVALAQQGSDILGYFSIIEESPRHVLRVGSYEAAGGFFLDNLFIHPAHIRRGVGRQLVALALAWCRERQVRRLHVVSDPNAKGFYEAMGAVYQGEVSSGSTSRQLPFLVFFIEPS